MKLLSKHNLYVGTNAERLASFATPPHEGADFFETDTGDTYTFIYGTWESVGGGGGSSTFLGLTDVLEATYVGAGGQMVVVNGAETGLEFTATVPAHDIVGASHTASGLTAGNVIIATAPTTFAWGQLSHSQLGGVGANDHHGQVHGIVSSDHTVVGSQYDVVGLTAVNTLGLLTPSSDPTGAAILRTDSSGYLGVERFGVGGAPSAPYGVNVDITYTGIAATIPAGVYVDFELNPSAAHSYPNASALAFLSTWNKAATIGALYGVFGSLINNTTGTITLGVGARFGLDNISTGFITNAYGVYVATPSDASGGIGTGYGLYVGNWPDYTVYTESGLVSFGDSLQFRQASTISTTSGNLTLDAAGGGVQIQDYIGINVAPSSLADIRANRTATNESSLNASIWTSLTAQPANAPVAGTTYRGMLLQVNTSGSASLSNVTTYGFLGQVTHGNTSTLASSVGVNVGTFLTSTGTITSAIGVQIGGAINSGGGVIVNHYGLLIGNISGGTALNRAISTGTGIVFFGDSVGFGVTSPQGIAHGHDGTGGFIRWSHASVAGTAVTVIPNGTGDILYDSFWMYTVRGSSGVTASGSFGLTPGLGTTLYNSGGNTLAFNIAADGSVTVQRTAGALTYRVALWGIWL